MKEERPVIEINGVEFLVDVDYGLYREKTDPEKFISPALLEDAGTHYLLKLPGQRELSIPYMVKSDPEGISDKYGIPVKDLPETDRELKCNPELVADRLQGRLPTIELEGHTFFVDFRLRVLRPKDDFSTMGIELDGLPLNESGTGFQFLYDPKTHTEVVYDKYRGEIPRGTVPLEIPAGTMLDPIAVIMAHSGTIAAGYPYADRTEALELYENSVRLQTFLSLYPVRYNLKARVIPRNRTVIPEQAARNKQKNNVTDSPRKVKKAKGRGL